jgi:hypothetical protein
VEQELEHRVGKLEVWLIPFSLCRVHCECLIRILDFLPLVYRCNRKRYLWSKAVKTRVFTDPVMSRSHNHHASDSCISSVHARHHASLSWYAAASQNSPGPCLAA